MKYQLNVNKKCIFDKNVSKSMNSKKSKLYLYYYKSIFLPNLAIAFLGMLMSVKVFFVFFSTIGLALSFLLFELRKKEEYLFYYNLNIRKSELYIFCFIANIIISTLSYYLWNIIYS